MVTLRSVTATGTGFARAAPDAAVLRVAVTHRAAGVAEAFAGVDSAARAVAAMARDFTDAARVMSAGFTVWPAYDNHGGHAGFEARHGFTIGCADLASAGALLGALAHDIGDRLVVEGISLEISDKTAALVAAREAAFLDARQKAEHLAALSGESLGPVLSAVDSGGDTASGAAGMAFAKDAAMAIEPGESRVGAWLTVTWEFS
ncbi:MAG: SIMPL domain-containing protein [Nocardioides sp.]